MRDVPAIQVGSIALGVYGHLDANEHVYALEEDCYSAFHSLSAATGHLNHERADGAELGSWGMNDAGGPWLGADRRERRAQFQVTPANGAGEPLPIEAFTCTAVAAVERFAALELHGLEYYLPLELAGSAASRVQSGAGWFTLAGREARTRVRVTLDSGESMVVVERVEEILQSLSGLGGPEELEATVDVDCEPVDFPNPVPWRWWLGAGPANTTTFDVTATEWTPLAIGRVTTLFAEAFRSIGVTEAIGVRIVRAQPGP